jgi:hypothetical protein
MSHRSALEISHPKSTVPSGMLIAAARLGSLVLCCRSAESTPWFCAGVGLISEPHPPRLGWLHAAGDLPTNSAMATLQAWSGGGRMAGGRGFRPGCS